MADTSTPAFAVYTVIDRGEKQDPFWLRIGAAWKHKDGHGYNVTLDALPANGRIVLREPKEEEPEPEKVSKKR